MREVEKERKGGERRKVEKESEQDKEEKGH